MITSNNLPAYLTHMRVNAYSGRGRFWYKRDEPKLVQPKSFAPGFKAEGQEGIGASVYLTTWVGRVEISTTEGHHATVRIPPKLHTSRNNSLWVVRSLVWIIVIASNDWNQFTHLNSLACWVAQKRWALSSPLKGLTAACLAANLRQSRFRPSRGSMNPRSLCRSALLRQWVDLSRFGGQGKLRLAKLATCSGAAGIVAIHCFNFRPACTKTMKKWWTRKHSKTVVIWGLQTSQPLLCCFGPMIHHVSYPGTWSSARGVSRSLCIPHHFPLPGTPKMRATLSGPAQATFCRRSASSGKPREQPFLKNGVDSNLSTVALPLKHFWSGILVLWMKCLCGITKKELKYFGTWTQNVCIIACLKGKCTKKSDGQAAKWQKDAKGTRPTNL